MRALAALIILFGFFAQATAQRVIDSPEADRTALTIYPDNLAMVTEVRKINIPAGVSTIRFLGVSDEIIAQTAVLQSFSGFNLESNFDSDVITKGALISKAVGQDIKLRQINPATGQVSIVSGRLRSASNINNIVQGAVIETAEGLIAYECAGLMEALVFSGLPRSLNPKPVLSMNVVAEAAGEAKITLTYLTEGIEWEADYRLDVLDGQAGKGPLRGWLTIQNNTTKSFKNVPTAVIAGQLNRDYDTESSYVPEKQFSPYCWAKGSTKTGIPAGLTLYQYDDGLNELKRNRVSYAYAQAAPEPVAMYDYEGDDEIVVTGSRLVAKQENFADYKLYRLPQPITIAALQTKQIAFLGVEDAEYERVYKMELDWWDIKINADQRPSSSEEYIEIDNSKDGNLAKPLPKGNVWVMTRRDNGKTAFLGETDVKDMPVDLPVELDMGYSEIVQVVPTLALADHEGREGVRIGADILNPLPEDIIFEFTLNASNIGLSDIQGSSHAQKADEARPVYKFTVPAESREPFYLFFEYDESHQFFYDDIVYDADEPGDEETEYSTSGFSLKSGGGSVEWLTILAEDKRNRRFDELEMTATLKSVEEFEETDDDNLFEGRVRETFRFKNTTNDTQIVTFDFDADMDVFLEKTNIEPESHDPLFWRFEIRAGKTVKLDITYLAESLF